MQDAIVLTDQNIEKGLKIIDNKNRHWIVSRFFNLIGLSNNHIEGWEIKTRGVRRAIFQDEFIHYRIVQRN